MDRLESYKIFWGQVHNQVDEIDGLINLWVCYGDRFIIRLIKLQVDEIGGLINLWVDKILDERKEIKFDFNYKKLNASGGT